MLCAVCARPRRERAGARAWARARCRHGRLLAARGSLIFHGVERSTDGRPSRAALRRRARGPSHCESPYLFPICASPAHSTRAIALFHVISYQTGNDDLLAAFGAAADHLRPGGVFLFDVGTAPPY